MQKFNSALFGIKPKTIANNWFSLSRTLSICSLLALASISNNSLAADPMGAISSLSSSISKKTDGRINLSGYFNFHYMDHDGAPEFVGKNINDPLFQIREASVFADIVVTDNIIFSTELEMSYDFSDEDTSGRNERFKARLNYYYVDLDVGTMMDRDSGSVSVRFGRILVPFLQYNENKPNFKQSLMSQPFTAWQMAPVNNVASSFDQFGWTDLGVMFDWKMEAGNGIVNLKLSAINGLGVEGQVLDNSQVQLSVGPTVRPRDGLNNARSEWDEFSDTNSDLSYTAKLSYSPFAFPLNFGASWYSGTWDEDAKQSLVMTGLHFEYLQRKWHVKGEVVYADVEQMAGINPVTAMGPAMLNRSTGDYKMKASYLESGYEVLRYGGDRSKYVKLVFRHDEVDTNDKAMFTPFNRKRDTYGIEWEFMSNVKLRYEYQKHILNDFDRAPGPFKAAGGEEEITMNMISIISNF